MTENLQSPIPRSADATELDQLVHWLCEQGHDEDDATLTARIAYIAVYDNYMTDGPGYTGKLMSVVWGGSPDTVNIFVWKNGHMIDVDRGTAD